MIVKIKTTECGEYELEKLEEELEEEVEGLEEVEVDLEEKVNELEPEEEIEYAMPVIQLLQP